MQKPQYEYENGPATPLEIAQDTTRTEPTPEQLSDWSARVIRAMKNSKRNPYPETPASPQIADWTARMLLTTRANTIRPTRGLALWGYVGTGKSTAMRCISDFLGFGVWSMTKLSETFARSGDAGIWSLISDYTQSEIAIDDLGAETANKRFGATIPIADLVCARYESWQRFGTLTHFTGNLTEKERETLYGTRVSDRINEMTVAVKCTWDSFRTKA